MPDKDYQDILSGLALTALGLAVLWYAGTQMRIGTLVRMGPGMFPFGIGLLIAALGAMLSATAFFRSAPARTAVNWRALGFILLGVLVFALIVRPLGLVPAVVAVITISSLANTELRPVGILCLNLIMSVIAILIFKVGLGMNLAIISWSF